MDINENISKILVVDPIDQLAITQLEHQGFLVDVKLFPEPDTIVSLLDGYDALICRTHTKLDKVFFEQVRSLKCVALASTGYDQIDLEAATASNVAIVGLPSANKKIDTKKHGNFISTAEHTILLLLAALGNFYDASKSMKDGLWEKPHFVGIEAYGKKLGFVGFGRISKLVAARAQSFGMETVAYDPYVSVEEMSEHNTAKVDLNTLCCESDVITIHAPKTKETISLLDEKMFSLMKQDIVIINAARSEIIEKESLLKALNSGKVKKIALDVFNNEPYGIDWDIVNHKSVIPTPHIGGSTHEAMRRISLSTANSLADFLLKGDTSNVINK